MLNLYILFLPSEDRLYDIVNLPSYTYVYVHEWYVANMCETDYWASEFQHCIEVGCRDKQI